jgi:hypothetical protein
MVKSIRLIILTSHRIVDFVTWDIAPRTQWVMQAEVRPSLIIEPTRYHARR